MYHVFSFIRRISTDEIIRYGTLISQVRLALSGFLFNEIQNKIILRCNLGIYVID